MQFGFRTNDVAHAKCSLLLYAMYRSRNKNSSLNGIETWNRFTAFIRGACLKSATVSEFCTNFCKMAKVDSIKPCYLQTGEPVELSNGVLISSNAVKDYQLDIFDDNKLLKVFETEGQYLTMLVRERIQRDKMEGLEDENED